MRATTQRLTNGVPNALLPAYTLMVLWLLGMISVPILQWTFGERAIVIGVVLTTLLQAAAALAVLWASWGARRALLTALGVVALTWAAEALGTATGFPFGAYHYTDLLQPQLLNVPVLIAVAWLMMLPSAWVVAGALTGGKRGPGFIGLAALAMTAWDLYLDPQMVGWGLWVWPEGGGYFGVPWVNFAGWLLTAALVTAVVRPRALPAVPLLTLYTVVWLFQAIGQAVFWGQVGPAVVGFVVMGVFVAGAWWRWRQQGMPDVV